MAGPGHIVRGRRQREWEAREGRGNWEKPATSSGWWRRHKVGSDAVTLSRGRGRCQGGGDVVKGVGKLLGGGNFIMEAVTSQ